MHEFEAFTSAGVRGAGCGVRGAGCGVRTPCKKPGVNWAPGFFPRSQQLPWRQQERGYSMILPFKRVLHFSGYIHTYLFVM